MILAIDTSLGTAVAVVEADGAVRADHVSANPLGHAEVIGDLLAAAVGEAEAIALAGADSPPEKPGDPAFETASRRGRPGAAASGHSGRITHVAAGMGPGPFTGLRVGIAAARAFATGRGIRVVPVPSHDAAALGILLGAEVSDTPVHRFAVVTDARRREYAYTVYDGLDDDRLPHPVTDAALAPHAEIDAVLAQYDAIRYDLTAIPASMVGLCAARALAARRTPAAAEPLYLRAPDVTLPAGPKKVGV